jgi:chromate transporter
VYPTILAVISAALKRIASHSLHSLGAIGAGLLACTLELISVPFWISLLLAALIVEIASRGQKKLAIGGAISFGLVAIWYTATQSAGAAHVAATQIASGHVSILDLSWIGLKAGLLTFGGAYTVSPFLEADAVHSYAWITQAQFMDGIALGGMIPAPLVIFASFLGWLGGGFFGALAITFGIFLPAFLFTLLGHEVFERLMEHRSLQRLLEGVAAGVVGIMAATVLEFYQHLITSYQAALICALSLLLLLKFKWKYTAPALILVNTTLAVMVSL